MFDRKIHYTASEFKFKLITLNWKIRFSVALITFQFLNSHMWLVVTQLETKPFINQREFIEEKYKYSFFSAPPCVNHNFGFSYLKLEIDMLNSFLNGRCISRIDSLISKLNKN